MHEHALPEASTAHGYSLHKEDLIKRLRRIEGQIRGLQKMIEDDRYCVDILTQVSAAKAALDSVGMFLLEHHTHGCVAGAIKRGEGTEAVEELMGVVRKLL